MGNADIMKKQILVVNYLNRNMADSNVRVHSTEEYDQWQNI